MHPALKYIQHYITGQTRHDVHSPFMYKLLEKDILDTRYKEEYRDIESLKWHLMRDNTTIEVVDFGAGGHRTYSKQISAIAKNSAIGKRHGRLLYRLSKRFQPQYVLELGTSLGIGTAYLAKGAGKVVSVEGSPETAVVAAKNLQELGINNVEIVVGNFDETLPAIISTLPRLDLVFFDGNHAKEPTLRYFELCLQKAHNNTVFIFHDIHWSAGMEEAWSIIQQHNAVNATADLHFSGLVFFRDELTKQHYRFRF